MPWDQSTGPHRCQEEGPGSSASCFCLYFSFRFLMDTRAFSKPLPPADFLLSLQQTPFHIPTTASWGASGQHGISGFGHTTCFGQWNVRGCGVSRSLDVLSPLALSFCPYVIHHKENVIQDVSSPRSMKDTWERSRLNL